LKIKLSDYVIQVIADHGVKHMFMVPGGGAMHLNDSLGKNPQVDFVCNNHEQASTIAAEAYARVTGRFGAALVTTGPGGTNAITGVAGAWLDSTPCIIISGQVKRADLATGRGLRQLGVQEIDIVSIVTPITKYAVTIMEPASIRYHLEKALYLAQSGRPGPVWIDIPLDVQATMIEPELLESFTPPEEDTQKIDLQNHIVQALGLLQQSQHPVILVGNGVRIAGAKNQFLQLAQTLNIPVLTTRLGVDLISADHPLCFGMPGTIAPRFSNYVLQNSDWLLILGARLDMALIAYSPANLARAAKKIMVNIDPAEIEKVKEIIDVSIVADVRAFIETVLQSADMLPVKDRLAWLEQCKDWKQRYPFVLPAHYEDVGAVSMYAFSETMSQELPTDSVILPGNAGNASELFLTAFSVKDGQRVFHNKGTGAMGFCQPAAIGACLASGSKLTVCVDGDGGFQFNIQELEVVKRLGLPIKFFVMNNKGYASIRASQNNYFKRLTGADSSSGMTLPDTIKIANAFGLPTTRIENHKTMRSQIREILNAPGPMVCDVTIIPDEPRAPRVSSIQRPDGSMVSKPLEDMWPFLDREEFRSNMIVPALNEDE
jgi:acetolactate synthase-1/2/3 large subunit